MIKPITKKKRKSKKPTGLLNSRVTEIGVGYVFSKFSAYGGYWTVVMGGE